MRSATRSRSGHRSRPGRSWTTSRTTGSTRCGTSSPTGDCAREAVSLAWADVHLASGSLRVAGAESGTSQRTVLLDAATVHELRAHRTPPAGRAQGAGTGLDRHRSGLSREDGTLLARNVVSDRFGRLVRVTGLPPIRLHDLRHAAASLAYRATRDLKMVSEPLGHSGLQITGDIYTLVFEEVDRDAAEAVARLVPRPTSGRPSATVCRQRVQKTRRGPTGARREQSRRSAMVGRVGLEPTTEG